jgi:SAM-dependent methyltransferase
MKLHAFVHAHLPPVPARVLEVGCGRGDLARALARTGHRVVAIDPHAPAGDLFRAATLEDFADPEPFDAVVASLALHHVADLPGALDKIVSLLRPAGRLILNEHAVDRLDEPTARWYLEKRAQIRPDAPRSLEQCLHEWEEDHAELHGYTAMRAELDRRFTERFFGWVPYLYGELAGAVGEAEERALIDAGAIQALGFHYVGERQVTESYQQSAGEAARTPLEQRSDESRADEEGAPDAERAQELEAVESTPVLDDAPLAQATDRDARKAHGAPAVRTGQPQRCHATAAGTRAAPCPAVACAGSSSRSIGCAIRCGQGSPQ